MNTCLTIITGIFSGIISSYIVSWLIIRGQYQNSITKHRIDRIKIATADLVKNFNNLDKKRSLQNRHRNSLSVIINACIESFGPYQKDDSIKRYPGLIDEFSHVKGEETWPSDAWQKFNLYIKPVKDEINQFSLIFPVSIFGIKDLRIIRKFLIEIELIIEGLDALRLIQIEKGMKIIRYDGDSLMFPDSNLTEPLDELEYVKIHYNILEQIWNEWLELLHESAPT